MRDHGFLSKLSKRDSAYLYYKVRGDAVILTLEEPITIEHSPRTVSQAIPKKGTRIDPNKAVKVRKKLDTVSHLSEQMLDHVRQKKLVDPIICKAIAAAAKMGNPDAQNTMNAIKKLNEATTKKSDAVATELLKLAAKKAPEHHKAKISLTIPL
ncbi:MAG: hypothetical protein EB059_07820 [Alphaproteobacteria bacterium]|nr:hypothetical protein [Alphaproteobacteria bacterium]